MDKLFFELIKVSIGACGCLSKTPTADEWHALYDMATKQSLVGVCFAGVQRLGFALYENTSTGSAQAENENHSNHSNTSNLSKLQYLTWMGMAAKIQQRNEVVNRQCIELQERLMGMGYRSCIIKGQSNHPAYSSLAMLRQSGDIDIWIEGGRERVVELVYKICPTKKIHETHAELDVFEDTEVEAHYRPGLIRDFCRNSRLQKFFQENAEECFTNRVKISAGEIVAGTPRFNAVQQLLHVYHHLFDSGIGLRQVLDYYFVLTHLPSEEKDGVMKVLREVRVARFTAALMYVLQTVFGLEDQYLLCPPSEKDGEYLLNEMLEGGNFGFHRSGKKKHKGHSYLRSFFGKYFKNFRHRRFAPMEWLMSPLWRVYYFGWRKMNGYY